MELEDTTKMMNNEYYKERLREEYYQLKVRTDNLTTMLNKYYNKTLEFTPASDIEVFERQHSAMKKYLFYLYMRAKDEGIEL